VSRLAGPVLSLTPNHSKAPRLAELFKAKKNSTPQNACFEIRAPPCPQRGLPSKLGVTKKLLQERPVSAYSNNMIKPKIP